MQRHIPVVDFSLAGSPETETAFVQQVGDALKDIGFFALANHGINLARIESAYSEAEGFFDLDETTKRRYARPELAHQRGYTPFGTEHAKDNPAPDLKEFWQTGRSHEGSSDNRNDPVNVWPNDVRPDFEHHIDGLYRDMRGLADALLAACSRYLGHEPTWLPEMTKEGDTIIRIIHYPPLDASTPEGAVRSAAHEDINFITLLVTATAAGLQVQDHDGTWIEVEGNHEHIIVDSGDMLQNLTNGLFKSTTHRVVNPGDPTKRRFSMPMFVHPRNGVDLSPRDEFVKATGGTANYPSITAGAFLRQRLQAIGLATEDGA